MAIFKVMLLSQEWNWKDKILVGTWNSLSDNLGIVCKGVPAPSPFLRHTPLTQLAAIPPPPFRIFLSLPFFLFHPLLRYSRQFPPTLTQPSPTLIRPTNLPYCKKHQKDDFTSSTVAFYQKSIFNLLNPFTNRLSMIKLEW